MKFGSVTNKTMAATHF